jgi:S1-C subfamily serine protease
MEQQFACPHCQQTVVAAASATAQQAQCPHCSGIFMVPASPELTPATTAGVGQKTKAAERLESGNASMKYLLAAGALMLFMAGVPILAYGVIRLSSAPKPAVAKSDPAPTPASGPEPKTVVLTGRLTTTAHAEPPSSSRPREMVRPPASLPPTASTPTASAPTASTPTASAPISAPAPRPAPTLPPAAASIANSPVSPPSPLASLTAAPSAAPPSAASDSIDARSLIEQVERSVVVVQVTLEKGSGIGSGFPLDDQGTIVTNYHVIEGAKSASIKFGAKTADIQGFFVYSPGKDIAILKANLGPEKIAPLKLALNKPAKGESVFTFGAPLGFDSTVSNGIVSSLRKGTELQDIFKKMTGSDTYVEQQHYDLDAVWVQTTAPISGGNSGGPLVTLKGEVVGLNTWAMVRGQNMNFAISADHIKDLMKAAQSGVHPLAELPKPRERSLAAGDARRTLDYWDEVSRINRVLATRIKKIRQPPIPSTLPKLMALFPKLAGIYKKMGDMLPDAAAKLKALKIDDVDEELVALVTLDALYLEKIGAGAREMSADIKRLRLDNVAIYDYDKLSKKAYGEFQNLELGQAYDVLRIRLTSRYGLTFASIFDGSLKAKPADDAAHDDSTSNEGGAADASDSLREKQAAGKLKLAKQLQQAGKHAGAKERLQQIVDDYPGTKAADEAQALLKKAADE